MPKRSVFACDRCGYQAPKWLGRCPECGAWGSLAEEVALDARPEARPAGDRSRPLPYPEVPTADAARTGTGIDELDRVLGGGLVPGAVILIGGEPGIGKSTLLLQAGSAVAESGRRVLYVTGEESAAQLRLRGDRLGVGSPDLLVLAETDVESIGEAARAASPALLVVDSVQAVRCADLGSVPGAVGQVREAAGRFVALAKATATPVILVGHVTKDGALAGPRALEHVVDTVVSFEGDRHHAHRILRTLKNRFGPSDELGVFSMTDRGLEGVASPSELFLAERATGTPGSAVVAAVEGTRPLLVEVQALLGEPTHATPRRTSLGIDANRLAMILAVLHRRAGVEVANRDVFLNVVGGMTIVEPAADLAVAAAAVSSDRHRPVPAAWTVAGEIGLTGEVRSVSRLEARLREASRLGFEAAVVPAGAGLRDPVDGVTLHAVRHLTEALDLLFP
jgi:DNA repair protein RadA/Sms